MSRLTWVGTAEPVSRDQIFRRERGQGNIIRYYYSLFSSPRAADWQPYPVDPYFCYMCGHTYIQTSILCTKIYTINSSTTAPPQYHFSYFISRDQILRRERGRGKYHFPATVATSRIGSHARLIHTPLKVLTYTNNLSWGIAEQNTGYTVPMYTQK